MTPFEFGQFIKQAVGPQPAPTPAGQNRTPELIAKMRQQGITSGSWTSLPDGSSVQRAVTYGKPGTAPAAKPVAPKTPAVAPTPANAPKVQTQRTRSAF